MERLQILEEKINQLDYRLRLIEKFLDNRERHPEFLREKSEMDLMRINIIREMRDEIKDLNIKFDNEAGTKFYNQKNITQ